MDSNNSVLLQSDDGAWLRFRDPVRVVTAERAEQVRVALREVEDAVTGGMFAAGFVTYEAAPGLDNAFRTHERGALPLLWFGLYSAAESLPTLPPAEGTCRVGDWQPSVTGAQYEDAISRIRRYIEAGDTYQVNYTIRLHTSVEGSAYALFHSLVTAQQAAHCAFVNTGTHTICSASPELFFSLAGKRIVSRPMKGTAPRGLTSDEDETNALALRASEKNRAENVMIVDMVRNDLGRVADAGSVRVTGTFEIEEYPTVLQMTSTVEARTKAGFADIMGAIFPPASITGAPKVRTMEIIREIETGPRGVYTGAVGYLAPDRRANFNVAIRTVVVDNQTGAADYGVGGGVVWDSVGSAEYEECLTKAKVLTTRLPEFDLLETFLWTPEEGYFLKDKHLARLGRSADYFGFRISMDIVEARLSGLAPALKASAHRVRLLAGRDGTVRVEAKDIGSEPTKEVFRVALARAPIDSQDRFLYHKTTNRKVYEDAKASRPECDDVILFNERGEITESTIANVVIERNGERLTPPVKCGLLPGVFREDLLERGEVREEVLTADDLAMADKIFLVNSVRRWIHAILLQE